MPGFDRTGPRGQGPRTGGGFGYCGAGARPVNNTEPISDAPSGYDYANRMAPPGRGGGFGGGFGGGGRGYGRRGAPGRGRGWRCWAPGWR